MKRKAGTELQALLQLLDDPDEEVYRQVHDRLMSYGPAIIPTLEKVWESNTEDFPAQRIEAIIHQLHVHQVSDELSRWAASGSEDVLEGALILSRYRYMNQNDRRLKAIVADLADQVSMELSYQMAPLEQVNIFNHVFFDINGYRSVPRFAEREGLMYLKEVLETRRGAPFLIALLYLAVARQLMLPVHGVLLPQHLVISYHKVPVSVRDDSARLRSSILFYVNPAHKGNVFTREAISSILHKIDVEPKPAFFLPASSAAIIAALIDQLKLIAELNENAEKAAELERLRKVIK